MEVTCLFWLHKKPIEDLKRYKKPFFQGSSGAIILLLEELNQSENNGSNNQSYLESFFQELNLVDEKIDNILLLHSQNGQKLFKKIVKGRKLDYEMEIEDFLYASKEMKIPIDTFDEKIDSFVQKTILKVLKNERDIDEKLKIKFLLLGRDYETLKAIRKRITGQQFESSICFPPFDFDFQVKKYEIDL